MQPDLTTFSGRLMYAMSMRNITQSKLAKAVDMAQSSINKLVNESSGSRNTVAIANYLAVNPLWLATGEGPMSDARPNTPPAIPQSKMDKIDPVLVTLTAAALQGALQGLISRTEDYNSEAMEDIAVLSTRAANAAYEELKKR